MFRHGLSARLAQAKRALLEDWRCGRQAWLGSPETCLYAPPPLRRWKTCLVLGIGGSDLGARAAWHALQASSHGMRLEFLGGNADPDEIAWTLDRIDLKSTLINIISKSGDTIESMSTFFLVRERLIKAVGRRAHAAHIIATTDEHEGSLLAFAQREGYATLPIPQNIGGRFSVLTAVGLFPLVCAGIDTRAMCRGAARIRDAFVKESPQKNDAVRFAALHVHGDVARHQPIHVLMPYSERLRLFGTWYRQLWAESLGKEGRGPTPVAALGATDQHSQLQLYMDGPADKLITFIDVHAFHATVKVPWSARELKPLSYLAGASFGDILHAERAATAHALKKARKPNGTLYIPAVNAETLGSLFMFFQIATGIAGNLYGVNAYDQPGVEAGKRLMRSFLKDAMLPSHLPKHANTSNT